MFKTAVLDVGSNSVRCSIHSNGNVLVKKIITSRLGEGVSLGFLHSSAIERTVSAICELKHFAIENDARIMYAFATEAVRRAKNKGDFLSIVKEKCNLDIYVADGDTEAYLAVIGALGCGDGAVIDLGGASTEIAVQENGKIIYKRSIDIGAVVLKDICGGDRKALTAYIAQKTAEYGKIPHAKKVVAIGGTSTSLAACFLKLKEYDAKIIHGAELSLSTLYSLANSFEGKSVEEIISEYAVDSRRAEIIFGGALLLATALKMAGAEKLIVSESDNLEGFYFMVNEGKIKAIPLYL